jgi:ribosome-binding protein aMBF1 (putative translation factor)
MAKAALKGSKQAIKRAAIKPTGRKRTQKAAAKKAAKPTNTTKPKKPLTRAQRAARKKRPLFARRLREARMLVGLTQEKLGIKAGLDEAVASSRMNHYEQGVHEPDFTMILRLARSIGISAAFFFCEDDALAEMVWALSYAGREI